MHRPRYDDWSLPKGKLEPGEHPSVAAVREIAEETGQVAVLGRPLPSAHYCVDGVRKNVRYWAARALGGTFRPGPEVDRLSWLDPADAAAMLDRESDIAVLDAFRADPADTRALILLRHGQALARRRWTGTDLDRPLRRSGARQAVRLVALLDTFGPRRVLSSPAVRCLLTVSQFACSVGIQPEILLGLAEQGEAGSSHADNFEADAFEEGRRRILAVAETASVVVCTHRPVLPGLCAGLGAPGLVTADDNGGLAPGEFLVIHHRGATPIATERHRS